MIISVKQDVMIEVQVFYCMQADLGNSIENSGIVSPIQMY